MNELLWHSRTRICGVSPPAGAPGHCRCAAVAFLTIFVGPPSAVWNVHPPFGYSEQLVFFLRIHSSLLLYKVLLLLLLYRWVRKRFFSHFDARCKSCRCDRFLYEDPACAYPHLFLYLSPPSAERAAWHSTQQPVTLLCRHIHKVKIWTWIENEQY